MNVRNLVLGGLAVGALVFGAAACSNGDLSAAARPTTATTRPSSAERSTTVANDAAPMVDVVCLDLQAAQDTIQDETDVWYSGSHDATGQDRMQILDRNWVVVAQSPAPGTPISADSEPPMLDVVKLGEPSPC